MKLKLCGIRRPEDVRYLNACPPDYAGFVFAESRRRVTADEARALAAALAPGILPVGVFVNAPAEDVLRTAEAARLAVLQLHGDEDAAYLRALRAGGWRGPVWKAVRVRAAEDLAAAEALGADALLLDAFSPAAYGGTGRTADWALIAAHRPRLPFFLAGGLHAGNLPEAVRTVRPDGVDLSGGVETDGCKDAQKIQEIYDLIRGV